MGLLTGKVAVVTGAGGGIGRAEALALAGEGARVVVNDLGSARDGTGQSARAADLVADEIRRAGGEAVASHDSVASFEGARAIIHTALETWGQIDVLVNNAGILRDKTLWNMTEEMWDAVIAVHLRGTFACTHFAAAWMREHQHPGRIVNTTSMAGLKGNFGQSNYAAAKAGIYGLTMVWALELKKYGITVNAIAPLAKTRMTEDIEAVGSELTPEQVAPVVVFLASDLAGDLTGRILGVHGPHLFEYRMDQSAGVHLAAGARWTPQEIARRLDEITRFAPPPAAPPAAGDQVKAAFDELPGRFLADKGATWTAAIAFEVAGWGEATLMIGGGAATVSPGRPAARPTCTVKTDAPTIVGVFSGTLNAQKAFMQGKIKADNLQDMMRFGQAFDLTPRAGGPSATVPAPAASDVGTGKDPLLDRVFAALPGRYIRNKAAAWNATIAFTVPGTGSWTLTVKDGAASIVPGRLASVTATVTVGRDVIVDLMTGKMPPQRAFMLGKMKADNMKEMMRFGMAFDLTRQESFDAAPPGEPVGAGQLNKALVGKAYEGGEALASPDGIIAYARATNETCPRFLDRSTNGRHIAPPLYWVAFLRQAVQACVFDPELRVDMLRLVHGEQSFRFLEPLGPDDRVRTRATVDSIEDKSSGQLLNLKLEFYRGDRLACDGLMGFFIRSPSRGQKREEPPQAPSRPAPAFEVTQPVDPDQPRRYAAASGDDNPIHLDPDVARTAGLEGVILHGLCTMAFAARAVVEMTAAGDPTRLREIFVRFAKPVYPGDTLTTSGWIEAASGPTTVAFETANQKGVPVLTMGRAVIGEPPAEDRS